MTNLSQWPSVTHFAKNNLHQKLGLLNTWNLTQGWSTNNLFFVTFCYEWIVILPKCVQICYHWRNSAKGNKQDDRQYVHDKVLYIFSWLHPISRAVIQGWAHLSLLGWHGVHWKHMECWSHLSQDLTNVLVKSWSMVGQSLVKSWSKVSYRLVSVANFWPRFD